MVKGGLGVAAVARRAGVSTATVSNVINRPHLVSPETTARVLAAIEELDFVPNRAAATLRQGANRLVGLVVPDIVNPFYAAIANAVSDAADREQYMVALCVSHDDPARERRHFDRLAEQRAVGALVVPLNADPSRLSQLRIVGARLVLVDRVVAEDEGCSVAVDDVEGGRIAVEHLVRTTSGPVSLVNGHRSIPQCENRRRGAFQALARAGLGPDRLVEFEVDEMSVGEGRRIGLRIAETGSPLSIFCTNDQLAVGVIRGLVDRGITPPRDARVVGYGDLDLAAGGALPLTTVAQPKRRLGEVALGKLLAELSEGSTHVHAATILTPSLVVRDSAPAVPG
ncbi:LacI family DNA-binding transcriptional regulator [Frankia sp. R43]|uniref:LacI family DNA-binding transcriptional regulator n=1 Tax=Frankia sp. R43 TaxID=269536 RepID=UPI0006C9F354|nr:LacI family DNA-binding transcriptional regulator [Frankia sp. R43]